MVHAVKRFLAASAVLIASISASYAQSCTGQFGAGRVCGNAGSSTGLPGATLLSPLFDQNFGSGQGALLVRKSSGWDDSLTSSVTATQNLNAVALPSALTGTVINFGQADSANARLQINAFGGSTFVSGVAYGGTNATPTQVLSGTVVAGIEAYAYNGSAVVGPIATLKLSAAENISSGHQGSKACLGTTPTASATIADGLCQQPSSGVTVGSVTDPGSGFINVSGGYQVNGSSIVPTPPSGNQGGIPYFDTTTSLASSLLLAQNQIVLGGGLSAAPATLGSNGTLGQILQAGGGTNAPAFSTSTYPSTNTAGTLLSGSSTNVITATATPVLGIPNSVMGQLGFAGSTSGTVTVTPQTSAGTPTLTLPNTSGTFAVGATSPIALNATTGILTCPTCATSSTPTGAALTASNDTNVTLTLGGSPTTALLNAASITAGWTGQLGLTRGGTNANLTAANGGVVYSTASALAILAPTATANLPLLSGSSTTPSWAAISYPASATSGGIPYFSSTSAMTSSGLLAANGFVLGGGAGAAPTTQQITGLVLGAGASAPGAYPGTSCTNQFPRSLNASGVATCASVANADLVNSTITLNSGTGITAPGAMALGSTYSISANTVADASGAPSATAGIMKCDGTTTTCASGVVSAVGAVASSISIGTTTISNGTDTRVLFQNGASPAGTIGEYAITGTGNVVMSASPTMTGTIAAASATFSGTVNKLTLTQPATGSTLTIADGKTATVSNTLTFTGTDSSSVAFGAGGTVTYTIASGTKALATSAIASGACSSAQTATATGTTTSDVVSASFASDPTGVTGYAPTTNGMLTIVSYPTADTVNFKVCNLTLASITPGAISLNWRVTR